MKISGHKTETHCCKTGVICVKTSTDVNPKVILNWHRLLGRLISLRASLMPNTILSSARILHFRKATRQAEKINDIKIKW
jgi:hypothetical protein